MLRAGEDGYVVLGPAAARREAVRGLLATRAGPAAAAQHGRATAAGKVRGRREVEQGAVRRLASFLSAAQGQGTASTAAWAP